MGWTDFDSDSFLVATSPSETARFDLEVIRITVGERAQVDVGTVIDEIDARDAQLTILRYPASLVEWPYRLAAGSVGTVYQADTLVYWQLRADPGHLRSLPSGFSATTDPDPEEVADLVEGIFGGYQNHYAANPMLERESVLEGYREWAVASTREGVSIRLDQGGQPCAVATLDRSGDFVEILLAGTEQGQRRQGIYSLLLGEVERHALETDSSHVVISTQSWNTPVQRAWARFGFLPRSSFNTVHVVRTDLPG